MGFSKKIKQQSLIASARHCCVCHRYKGVKVEVHHIIPKAKGGGDDLDNAIVLCFDCHADLCGYDESHPLGNKLTTAELREHRDKWYEIVKKNQIEYHDEMDILHCRYLICTNYEAFKEICLRDLSNLPTENTILLLNNIFKFHCDIIANNYEEFRATCQSGESFKSKKSYLTKYPKAILFSAYEKKFPAYLAYRKPVKKDLIKYFIGKDFITEFLYNNNIDIGEIILPVLYYNPCGDGFNEIFLIRPLWTAYLEITNITKNNLTLDALECVKEAENNLGYRNFPSTFLKSKRFLIPLPKMTLSPNQSILIPLSTFLAPFRAGFGMELSTKYLPARSLTDQYLVFSHVDYHDIVDCLNVLGPSIWPKSIHIKQGNSKSKQLLHDLDIGNLYLIDRSWMCGSCPHGFYINNFQGTVHYIGEIPFSNQVGINKYDCKIPSNINKFIIAELEFETTHILELYIDNKLILNSKHLDQGEYVSFNVKKGQKISCSGYYVLKGKGDKNDPQNKNRIVANFMRNILYVKKP